MLLKNPSLKWYDSLKLEKIFSRVQKEFILEHHKKLYSKLIIHLRYYNCYYNPLFSICLETLCCKDLLNRIIEELTRLTLLEGLELYEYLLQKELIFLNFQAEESNLVCFILKSILETLSELISLQQFLETLCFKIGEPLGDQKLKLYGFFKELLKLYNCPFLYVYKEKEALKISSETLNPFLKQIFLKEDYFWILTLCLKDFVHLKDYKFDKLKYLRTLVSHIKW